MQTPFDWSERRRLRSLTLLAAAFVLPLAFIPNTSRADLFMSISSMTANSDTQMGYFDVILTNTGINAVPIDVDGFNFQVSAASGSHITFADATTGTTSYNYIFPTYSAAEQLSVSSPASILAFLDNSSGSTLQAGDDSFDLVNFVPVPITLVPGDTLGLGHVTFTLDGSVQRGDTVTVSLSSYPASTVTNGGTDITPLNTPPGPSSVTAVPEPGPLLMGAIVAIGGGLAVRRSRRRSGQDTTISGS